MRGLARVRNVVARARRRGPKGIADVALSRVQDRWFDFRNGTDTCTMVPLDDLAIDSPNRRHGVAYAATCAADFEHVLRSLALPRGRVFVDLGCGKGRTLLLASLHPFARAVGVEFSGELCEVARRNVTAFRARHPAASEIEVVQADAADRPFAPDEDVFFLFHPFRPIVLEGVLENLAASERARPRPLWLIYNNPEHGDLVERSGLFGEVREIVRGRSRFLVYHRPASPVGGAIEAPAQ